MEIRCPETCSYLASARDHPAAVVRRQQEQDVALLLPAIGHLTERQRQLFFLLHAVIARHQPDPLVRLIDDDVAQAAGALAATLETAARGVVYEHTPSSPAAQRLSREVTSIIAEMRAQGTRIYDGELAITLRAIEKGAREIPSRDSDDTAYVSLVARLLQQRAPQSGEALPAGTSLILP